VLAKDRYAPPPWCEWITMSGRQSPTAGPRLHPMRPRPDAIAVFDWFDSTAAPRASARIRRVEATQLRNGLHA